MCRLPVGSWFSSDCHTMISHDTDFYSCHLVITLLLHYYKIVILRLLFRLFFYHKFILCNDTDSDKSFMVFLWIFNDFPKILKKSVKSDLYDATDSSPVTVAGLWPYNWIRSVEQLWCCHYLLDDNDFSDLVQTCRLWIQTKNLTLKWLDFCYSL